MSRHDWKRLEKTPDHPEAWYALTPDGEPICVFFRDADRDNAWVIEGTGTNGSHFIIVSTSQLVEDIRKEAELTLYDFGWVPRDGIGPRDHRRPVGGS